jgi:adenylate cyclase
MQSPAQYSPDDFTAVGLYDPKAHADTGRLDLLHWLTEQGFTLDELVHAEKIDALGSIAGDRMLVPGQLIGKDEAAALAGIDNDRLEALSIALGYVPIDASPAGEVGYTETDAATFAAFAAIEELFTPEEAIALLRVFGASLTRMAEASVSLFLSDVESQHIAEKGSELDLAVKVRDATAILDGMMTLFDPVMRRQVMQAIERTRQATIGFEERFVYRYAIGFVDLVGFTSRSDEMSGRELARFLRDFEARAFDAVTSSGGRVVKLIGDEVMFATTRPAEACAAAQGLMAAFDAPGGEVLPRGGLAYGDVLVRGGDYYGSTVNLASRLADEAVPQEVLVNQDLVEAAVDNEFVAAGRRMVRGFDTPVDVWSLRA